MRNILSYVLKVLLYLADTVEALLEQKFERKDPPFEDDIHDEYLMGWRECGELHPKNPDIRCVALIPTTKSGVVIPHINHIGYSGSVNRMQIIEWEALKAE